MLKESVMTISVEEDAKQRIENVVEKYQSDGTRTNYTMETRPELKFDSGRIGMVFTMFLVSLFGIYMFPVKGFPVFWSVLAGVMFICLLGMLYTNTAGRFKVKVWRNDFVSEADLFYLCENSGLKAIIQEMIAKGAPLTYARLNHNKLHWLGKIIDLRINALRNELVKKIDKVEEAL